MKRLFTKIIFTCLLPLSGFAQITITQSDFPAINDVWIKLGDYRYGMHTIGPGGANMTWNYSSAFVVDDTSGTQFLNVSAAPSAWNANFPGATGVLYDPADSAAQYLKANSSGFYLDGIYDGSAGSLAPVQDFNPDMLYFPVPFTYNSSRSNTARVVVFASDGTNNYKFTITRVQQFNADAYGSLTTPAGTYPNTLRIKEFSYAYDSLFVDIGGGNYFLVQSNGPNDTTVNYSWLKNGTGTLLMEIQADGANPSVSENASYWDPSVILTNVESPVTKAANSVYPNPSSSFINFRIEDGKAETIRIYNTSGQVLRNEQIGGANSVRFSTESFKNGTYLYTILDKDGIVLQPGRFIIAK